MLGARTLSSASVRSTLNSLRHNLFALRAARSGADEGVRAPSVIKSLALTEQASDCFNEKLKGKNDQTGSLR
ncbi:MAG: hypothetical protein QOE96_2088 [Blastocatellia bacterium]|jgi:hypothetical protein|nr:hypothetical protein [Blastocatellia bacterium]